MNKKAAIWLVAVPLLAMIASGFLLTAIFGPTDNGLSCTRDGVQPECEIRQTRFFGLVGNSSFSLPETHIRGARAMCSGAKVGGHASPSCTVYLNLDSGQEYPVLSYPLSSQAENAAGKVNAYFRSESARRIEVKEDIVTPALMFGVLPLVLGTLLFLYIRNRKTRGSPLAAQATR